MLLSLEGLRVLVLALVDEAHRDGRAVEGFDERARSAASRDELVAIGVDSARASRRPEWPWVEPDGLEAIRAASTRAAGWDEPWPGDAHDAAERVRASFGARVAGCVLGKPLELGLSHDALRACLEPEGWWPLDGYLPEAALDALPERQPQWAELVRERIRHVAPDDDLNYTVLAMLVLEAHGLAFTHEDLATRWRLELPVAATFGPERARVAAEALRSLVAEAAPEGVTLLEPGFPLPGQDLCGALIRADAYAYAAPGRPGLAAELAHRDASFTHRGLGVHGAMFVAAALSCALAGAGPVEALRAGRGFVPDQSRLAAAVDQGMAIAIRHGQDWAAACAEIEAVWPEHGHCRVLREVAKLVVTAHVARDAGHGILVQVMQGDDTDSFGATAGSLLGAALGPIDPVWLAPFGDRMHLAMALFQESSLTAITERMAALTRLGAPPPTRGVSDRPSY